jgi:hypothetical protein
MEVLIKKLSDFEKTDVPYQEFIDHPELSDLASRVFLVNNCIDILDCKYIASMGYKVVQYINSNNEVSLAIVTLKGLVKFTV